MKLYDAAWAPSPRRVRIFLAEKGVSIPSERIDIRRDEHMTGDYAHINPRRTLPALLLDDGTLIDDSLGICRFVEALHPDPPLFGRTAAEIGLIESWVRRIEQDCYNAVVFAFRNSHRAFADRALSGQWPPVAQIPELVERGKLIWEAFADSFDQHLATHPFVAGDRFSMADIVALVAVDFGMMTGLPDPRGRMSLARWHGEAAARPSAAA